MRSPLSDVVLLLLSLLAAGAATDAVAQSRLPGYTPASSARQQRLEAGLAAAPDVEALHQHLDTLTREPRVAGTPAQTASADYVLRVLARHGFDTLRVEYQVYLPYPESTYVDRVRPRFGSLPLRLLLNEIPVAGDSIAARDLWPAMAAYSGWGDTTGPLVFAHFGRAEDYALLDSVGVRVAGTVALVRLGRGGAGAQVREAERRGVAAVLLYADPADDGYVQGDPYPAGRMRAPDAVARVALNREPGDPATPGRAALAGVARLPRDSMPLPGIPVVPIGYRNVMHLLPALVGPSVPQAWQGGLPMRYHMGGDTSVAVRVAVWPETGDRAYKTIVNTVATLRGGDRASEVVLAGAHRDAWGRGATDNAGGVAVLLEAARALGEAAAAGDRPRRSVVVATWDGGEWGAIGATEYAEGHRDWLRQHVVAYLDAEAPASGATFMASGDPTLRSLPADAVSAVPAAGEGTPAAVETADPCGACLALTGTTGVAALELGFRDLDGVRHTGYDGLPFLLRHADPGLVRHRRAAAMYAVLLSRLGNAGLVPYDYPALGRAWSARLAGTNGAPEAAQRITRAAADFTRAAERWVAARDRALGRGAEPAPTVAHAAIAAARRAMTAAAPASDPATPELLEAAEQALDRAGRGLR